MATQYEEDLAKVKKYGLALEHVKEQTPAICLAAVQQEPLALQFVKKHTADLCLVAVKQDGSALRFVKEQTPEICLAAVKEHAVALYYVKEQSFEICLAAVNKNPVALVHVKDLHAIADEIDESTIREGLNSNREKVASAYQKIVKIREANAIANWINGSLSAVNDSARLHSKIKL